MLSVVAVVVAIVVNLMAGAAVGAVDQAVNQDATRAMAEANPFNEPAAGRYVLVDLAVTCNGTADEANPWLDLSTDYQATDARNYSASSCAAVEPASSVTLPALRTGGSATYQECSDVPAGAIAGGVVAVEQNLDSSDDQVVWAAG